MKKIILLITIPLISILPQSAGNSGLSFLKFGFGARNISMGDVGSVLSNDVTALYYNPANLAGTEGSQVMFIELGQDAGADGEGHGRDDQGHAARHENFRLIGGAHDSRIVVIV